MQIVRVKEPLSILQSKKIHKKSHYLVRWVHFFQQVEESWVPVSALYHYMHLVVDFQINGCQEKVPRASTKPKQLQLKKLTTFSEIFPKKSMQQEFGGKVPIKVFSSMNVNGSCWYLVRWIHSWQQIQQNWEPVQALYEYMYLVADFEINNCQVPRAITIQQVKEEEQQFYEGEWQWRPDENLTLYDNKRLVSLTMERVGWYTAKLIDRSRRVQERVMASDQLLRAYPNEFIRFLETMAF